MIIDEDDLKELVEGLSPAATALVRMAAEFPGYEGMFPTFEDLAGTRIEAWRRALDAPHAHKDDKVNPYCPSCHLIGLLAEDTLASLEDEWEGRGPWTEWGEGGELCELDDLGELLGDEVLDNRGLNPMHPEMKRRRLNNQGPKDDLADKVVMFPAKLAVLPWRPSDDEDGGDDAA